MDRIEKLFETAQEFYQNGDPGHDLAHVRRVMNQCKRLLQSEGGDREIVLAAALLHDVVNVPKNHPDRVRASELAALKSQTLLRDAGFSGVEIDRIGQVILEHSYSLGKNQVRLRRRFCRMRIG